MTSGKLDHITDVPILDSVEPRVAYLSREFCDIFRKALGRHLETGVRPDVGNNSLYVNVSYRFRILVVCDVETADVWVASLLSTLSRPRSGRGIVLVPRYVPEHDFSPLDFALNKFGARVECSSAADCLAMCNEAERRLKLHEARVDKVEANYRVRPI